MDLNLNLFHTMSFSDYMKKYNTKLYHSLFNNIIHVCYKQTKPSTNIIDKLIDNVMSNFLSESRFWHDNRETHSYTENPSHYIINDTRLNKACGTYSDGKKTKKKWTQARQAFEPLFRQVVFGSQAIHALSAYEVTDVGMNTIDDFIEHNLDSVTLHLIPVVTNAMKLDNNDIMAKLNSVDINHINSLMMIKNLLTDKEKLDWKHKADNMIDNLNSGDPQFNMNVPVNIQLMFDSIIGRPNSIKLNSHQRLQMFELLIYVMIFMYHGKTTDFVIPHRFMTKNSGRLFAKGRCNLQGSCKLVRHTCLSDFVDIDLECAAISVLSQLIKDVYSDFPTTYIDMYMAYKTYIRYALAKFMYEDVHSPNKFDDLPIHEQDDKIKQIKQLFTSMSFGVKDTTNVWSKHGEFHTSGLVEALTPLQDHKLKTKDKFNNGLTNFYSLEQNLFFKNFKLELELMFMAYAQVLCHSLNKFEQLECYPGCIFKKPTKSPDSKHRKPPINTRKLTAYFYQCVERHILDVIMTYSDDNLILPMHDGAALKYKLTDIQMNELKQLIYNDVGIKVDFSVDVYKHGHLMTNTNTITPSDDVINIVNTKINNSDKNKDIATMNNNNDNDDVINIDMDEDLDLPGYHKIEDTGSNALDLLTRIMRLADKKKLDFKL